MLRPILFLLFLLIMGGAVYILFFTQIVDRLLLKLKLGKRASSIESTASALDATVRKTVSDLRKEQEEVGQALETVAAIGNRPLIQSARTIETHPYVIRTIEKDEDEGDYLYWSNTLGWTKLSYADRFDHGEQLTLNIPVGGRWLRQRPRAKTTGPK